MRPPVVVAAVVVVLVAGIGFWALSRVPPEPAARPAEPAVRPAAPAAAPPTGEPAPVESPAAPARRTAPTPAAAPEPAAPAAAAAPTTATLRVETDVDNATVFIDRIGVGAAPISIPDLPPGTHRLNVSAPGYEGYAEEVTLEPGVRTITVKFKEIRLDARIAATHKHGLGSCKGELSATPEGLRYTATNGKDSMSVPFADVAAFDLDYLAKNLRLRTKQGQTLNFTDPEGNADRLFAFHRDVDKVRKRIASGQ